MIFSLYFVSWIPLPAKESQILISKSLVLPHLGFCSPSVTELLPPVSWGFFNGRKHSFDQNVGSTTSWMHIPNSPVLCFTAQTDPTAQRRKQGCQNKSWLCLQHRECFLASHTRTLKDLPRGKYIYTHACAHAHTHARTRTRMTKTRIA